MLTELPDVRQIDGEPHRRWFISESLDLIVWYQTDGQPCAFQICYDKDALPKALTWRAIYGFSHFGVDDGENRDRLHYKESPILVAGNGFNPTRIQRLFQDDAATLPADVQTFVNDRLTQYLAPASPAAPA
jgi:hypothetical protein